MGNGGDNSQEKPLTLIQSALNYSAEFLPIPNHCTFLRTREELIETPAPRFPPPLLPALTHTDPPTTAVKDALDGNLIWHGEKAYPVSD